MNICMVYSAADGMPAFGRNILRGRLSYIAQKNALMAEKLPADAIGDVMFISMQGAGEHIDTAIYDECRRRRYSSVFLDADGPDAELLRILPDISASLASRKLRVFCPIDVSAYCPHATPVAEAAVSGGNIAEYLGQLLASHNKLSLSIPRIAAEFAMPCERDTCRHLTPRELSRILDMHDAKVHFSPQMLVNYFIYENARGGCSFILFDDAHTMSEKIRLAKKLGIADVFIIYREISDIASDIIF